LRKALSSLAFGVLMFFIIGAARAEVVVIVAAENPIERLSRAELADIYLGRMNRFPNGGRAVPLDQKETAPAHDEFYSEYLAWSPARVKAHWSKLIFTGRGQPPRSVPGGEAMVEAVSGDPRAIGYVDDERVSDGLRVVRID